MVTINVNHQTHERFRRARRKLSFDSDEDLTEDFLINMLLDMHDYLSSKHSSKTNEVYR